MLTYVTYLEESEFKHVETAFKPESILGNGSSLLDRQAIIIDLLIVDVACIYIRGKLRLSLRIIIPCVEVV